MPNLMHLFSTVEIEAAQSERGPRRFAALAYSGGAIRLAGWDLPVVVDLAGLRQGNSLVANLDHKTDQRVGHVTETINDGKTLQLSGVVSAATAAAKEVVESADNGFTWQASIEASTQKMIELKRNEEHGVNGRIVAGPLFVVTNSVLKGFAFVSHGADDNTSVLIAASHDYEQLVSALAFDGEGPADSYIDVICELAGKSSAELSDDVELLQLEFERLQERREQNDQRRREIFQRAYEEMENYE